MKQEKKITADEILDLYELAKKTKGVKKEEIMQKVVYLSKHLNDYLPKYSSK